MLSNVLNMWHTYDTIPTSKDIKIFYQFSDNQNLNLITGYINIGQELMWWNMVKCFYFVSFIMIKILLEQ